MTTRLTHAEVARIASALIKTPRADEADLRTIAESKGMRPTAVDDALLAYPNDGSEPFGEWLDRMRPGKDHWWPPVEPGDDLDPALVEAACTAPTVDQRAIARAALYRVAGPELYAKVLAAWGCSPANLKPGKNPEGGKQEVRREDDVSDDSKKDAALSDNPWSANFRGSDAERAAKIGFFIKKGTTVAVSMAKAAGTVVGKPLRKSA